MAGLIRPIFAEPVKHLLKLITSREYFTYNLLESKLRRVKRFMPCRTKVHGWNLELADSASFLSSYKEIFLEDSYNFDFSGKEPKILDLGANVGLSVLYFKSIYPKAKIKAVEADPNIFKYLKNNIYNNGFDDVELINKAAWYEDCELTFFSQGADGGRAVGSDNGKDTVNVEAFDLRELLKNNDFDIIKMDIEGAESKVLPKCSAYLDRTKYIFVEYHSVRGENQNLNEILNVLAENNFRVQIETAMSQKIPFKESKSDSFFDLQLNIYGVKDDN